MVDRLIYCVHEAYDDPDIHQSLQDVVGQVQANAASLLK